MKREGVMKRRKMENKFNCWTCKYRGKVPGSAHICCNHPSVASVTDNPLLKAMGIFASVGRVSPIRVTPNELNIKGNPRGIENGWFNFPFNFDPVWLENCDGYVKKDEGK